jgi:YfiH family protein
MKRCQVGEVAFYTIDELAAGPEIMAAVSTRHGGVSTGPLASLNLGFDCGDEPARVQANRYRLCCALGLEPHRIVCARQVHGTVVRVVGEESAGAGFGDPAAALSSVDGLVTDQRGLALWLVFADCVPILAFDPDRPAVGIAHAGWRGTAGRIAAALVATMTSTFGSRPERLRVAIGPCIGPCCYAVGEEVVAAVTAAVSDPSRVLVASTPCRLDLGEANRQILVAAGVTPAHIALSGQCTACRVDEFYSHRAQGGRAGRMAAVVAVR